MKYRKWQASRMFQGTGWLNADQVVITNHEGKILDIVPRSEAGDEVAYFEGILTPGLINCHCHLELSHLKDVIPPHTGLVDFLCSVVSKRDFDREAILAAINQADEEMYANGIVGVGDIGNTADTLERKKSSRLRWQNFIEVLSFTDEQAHQRIAHYQAIVEQFREQLPFPHGSSLVPHAPYTISPESFRMIGEAGKGAVLSIHNQEHPAENELYIAGTGDFLRLFKALGMAASPIPVTGKSSLQSYLPYFSNQRSLLLVHNTYMPVEDMQFANAFARSRDLNLYYCLCPNANRYIENRLPPVQQFRDAGCQLVLGTDSYSSNWQLSITSEMKTLHEHFPELPLSELLQWATLNGARAMGWDEDFGSLEKGKQPGLVLLGGDLQTSRRLI